MRRRLALVLTAALGIGVTVAVSPPVADAAPPPLPSVYPVPQSMQAHGPAVQLGPAVALVAGPDADASAVAVVRQTLTNAGVSRIDQVPDLKYARAGESAIDLTPVGGDASGLAAEGYVLTTERSGSHAVVVLDGHDATGTYYAAQTLRQLVERHGQHAQVPGVRITDWPSFPLRGVIEGFYGTPRSHQDRLSQLDFYGAHKMNVYVYSPKDDPYLRAQWRQPYPPDQLAQIKELVDRAIADHVKFTYALSPGLSVCYSSASDEQALVAKFQTLWDIGVRDFAIPLDDISYTNWNCAADQAKFGTGGAAAGAAQAYLLNEVQRDFIATHPGADRLEMVPTEYSNVTPSPYKDTLKAQLDPAIVVEWTGVGVIAPVITQAQAAAAKSVFGHDILVWDNYPVNDYVTNQLLLGPYVGRDPGLAQSLYGLTANPMIEAEASKIALFNVADYTWNDTAYDAQKSWQASITELSGGDPQARAALAAFADLEYSSRLDPTSAPVLAAKIAKFWPAWERGDSSAARALDEYLRIIQWIPSTLQTRMNDPAFVSETQPWLDSASFWGQSARAALRMLLDERRGDGAAAVADRQRAESLMAKAKSYQYVGLNGTVNVSVGAGVIDKFVDDALAENDRWLGLAGRHTTAMTSMPAYENYVPANMVDGDDSTFFWSSRAPSPGDYVGVDLGTVQPIGSVSIHMSKPTSPNDYIHGGVLEYSADGSTWTGVGTYVNTPDIEATLPAGAQARYVRLRDTGNQSYWVVVREFTVSGPDNQRFVVSGTPAAASGSSLAAAADGNVDTSYVAASAPATGDALVVTLPAARPLDRVAVVGKGSATVQVGTAGGAWHSLGTLSASGYTELRAGGATVDSIRLLWTPGSAAPSIAEIIPWYADVPVVDLSVAPDTVDTSVGVASTLTVSLAATRPSDVRGRLSIAAPAGVTASPASARVDVPRGGQPTVTVTLTGSAAGTYSVPVTFMPSSGAVVSQTVTVVVHPKVSDTNVALAANGGVATASSVEDGLPQFTPDHAIDGDLTTRWSSNHDDNEWLQVQFASPQHLGKIVIVWETAHATAYKLQTSSDGVTWTDAADVTGSQGGTETVWIDQQNVSYLRMQGVTRATQYGYSIYEFEAYPIA